jgi:hypothetical protein
MYRYIRTVEERDIRGDRARKGRMDETQVAQLNDLLIDDVDVGLYDTIMHTCE